MNKKLLNIFILLFKFLILVSKITSNPRSKKHERAKSATFCSRSGSNPSILSSYVQEFLELEKERPMNVYLFYDSKKKNDMVDILIREFELASQLYKKQASIIDNTDFYIADSSQDSNFSVTMEVTDVPCLRIILPNGRLISIQLSNNILRQKHIVDHIIMQYDKFNQIDSSYEIYYTKSMKFEDPFYLQRYINSGFITIVYFGNHQKEFDYFSKAAETFTMINFAHCIHKDCLLYFSASAGDILIFIKDNTNEIKKRAVISRGYEKIHLFEIISDFSKPKITEFNEYAAKLIFGNHKPALIFFFNEKTAENIKLANTIADDLNVRLFFTYLI